jgi:hypothetical protein
LFDVQSEVGGRHYNIYNMRDVGRANDDVSASSLSLPMYDRRYTMLGSQSDVSLTSGSSMSCVASIVSRYDYVHVRQPLDRICLLNLFYAVVRRHLIIFCTVLTSQPIHL